MEGLTRGTVFKTAAFWRSQDAAVLFGRSRYPGAIYLAGYSIECYLKYAVCERRSVIYLPRRLQVPGRGSFTDLYTHNWDVLVEAAGIMPGLRVSGRGEALYSELKDKWSSELRYSVRPVAPGAARLLYAGLVDLYDELKDLVP